MVPIKVCSYTWRDGQRTTDQIKITGGACSVVRLGEQVTLSGIDFLQNHYAIIQCERLVRFVRSDETVSQAQPPGDLALDDVLVFFVAALAHDP